jgi:CBS domain-containing protein
MERGSAGSQAVETLRAHLPFSRMGANALEELARNLSETFFAKGEAILAPADGVPKHLLIVKQGRIRGAARPGAKGVHEDTWEIATGDCFPIRALLERRPVNVPYRAVEDTFCYLLPAVTFHRLLEISPEFLAFCSQRLQSLVQAAHDAARTETARNMVEQVPLTTPLGELVRRAPVVCEPDTPLAEAFERMARERVSSIVAVDADNRPRGIFTLRDVLPRVVVPRLGLEVPLSRVMSSPARSLPPDSLAWQAALEMARHGMAHLCVVQDERLVGVVSERDLFPMQRARLVPITRSIVEASDLPALQAAVQSIDPLIEHMLAQGLSAVPLIGIITTLNDHTTRRAIELCVDEHVAAHGPLPCQFTWLAFGSEGRQEQTLKTDQDNGMLLHLAPGQTPEEAREALLPLARSINAALEACGFPRCPGNIMAGNPQCCLSLEEWRERFARWVDQGAPEHLLDASIYFDLRTLYGDPQPVEALRDWLAERVPHNMRFLHQLTSNALRNRPPLSWLDNIVVARGGEHPNTINLKMQGTTPFVDAARVYALAEGVRETNTARRFHAIAKRGRLPAEEVESWVAAFTYLQSLRMQQHQLQAERHQPRSNHVDPEHLNALEQRLLKEVLRQVRHLQTRLSLDFGA